jgi:hypothetical protein
MENPIGIRPDSGVACFLCGKRTYGAHRLCANCEALHERRAGKLAVNPAGLLRALRPFAAAAQLPAPYRREG